MSDRSMKNRPNQQEEAFYQSVESLRESVGEVMPNTDTATEMEDLCRRMKTSYRDVRNLSKTSRSPIVAVVAKSPQSRRWLIQSMRVRLAQQLGSQATKSDSEVEGFGPVRPDWFPRSSRFDSVSGEQWNGTPPWSCLAVDPSLAERVDADVVFYVVNFEDVQTDAAVRNIRPLAGVPIVPVVLKATKKGITDVRRFTSRLEEALDNAPTLPCLSFPDFADKRTDERIEDAEREIWQECQVHVDISDSSRQQIEEERCEKIRQRFKDEARSILLRSDFKQVNQAIEELKDTERSVLREQTMKWVSGNDDLRVPLRIRLRLVACEVTPSLCFPFRSILGGLALTSGVWDRVAMAMLGSPVALALAAYQGGGQIWKSRNSLHDLTEDAGAKFSRTVVYELEDALSETRRAITSRLPGSQALTEVDRHGVNVRGAETLLHSVRSILDQNCRAETPTKLVRAIAILCTILFVVLFSGPIIALYGDYVRPLYQVWSGHSESIVSFPLPEVSRIFTGFVLGVIPGIICGMVLLAYLTRSSIVGNLTGRVRGKIHNQIDSMISDDVLTLEGMDNAFNHIRFLNSVMKQPD